MLAGLYRILLSRKAEGVIAHRMQDIETLQAFVSGIYVARDVSERVSHVKSRSRRIGKHIKDIKFGLGAVFRDFVCTFSGPLLLPLAFYFFEIVFHIILQQ